MIIVKFIEVLLAASVAFSYYQKLQHIGQLESRLAKKDAEIFDLDKALEDANQWVRIGEGKVKEWVIKHDELLVKYKALVK